MAVRGFSGKITESHEQKNITYKSFDRTSSQLTSRKFSFNHFNFFYYSFIWAAIFMQSLTELTGLQLCERYRESIEVSSKTEAIDCRSQSWIFFDQDY